MWQIRKLNVVFVIPLSQTYIGVGVAADLHFCALRCALAAAQRPLSLNVIHGLLP